MNRKNFLDLFAVDENAPIWVKNIDAQMLRMSLPLHRKASRGFVFAARHGYLFAGLTYRLDNAPPSALKLSRREAAKVFAAFKAARAAVYKPINFALLNLTIESLDEFCTGFAYGVRCMRKELKSMTPKHSIPVAATTAFPIYAELLSNRDKVEALRSVSELYDWLCDRLGTNTVGDFERIQKLCQRIKLGYRQPRRHRGTSRR